MMTTVTLCGILYLHIKCRYIWTFILAAPQKCMSTDFAISVKTRDEEAVETMETEGANI